jgi:hypothetical protein
MGEQKTAHKSRGTKAGRQKFESRQRKHKKVINLIGNGHVHWVPPKPRKRTANK